MSSKKILLVRDYSGMLSQIADSLRVNGDFVQHASISDAYKGNYGCDVDLELKITGNKLLDQYLNYLKLALDKKKYDVVHLQTQLLGGPYSALLLPIIKLLRSKGEVFTVSLAGDDYNYWERGPNLMKYGPFEDVVSIDLMGRRPYYASWHAKLVCGYVEKIADYLIPSCYDYAICHEDSHKLTTHVPFLWNITNTPERCIDLSSGKAIRIFHGIGRKGFKGSSKIMDALRRLEIEYKDSIKVAMPERVSYSEYKKYLEGCDIFVDQCNSYSYGMAAVEALALGKVVLSGAEPEALKYMKAQDCPVINILPDSTDIYNKLKCLLDEQCELVNISKQSREFAERFHSPKNVLPKLYDIWS